jgi:hypothetical protein
MFDGQTTLQCSGRDFWKVSVRSLADNLSSRQHGVVLNNRGHPMPPGSIPFHVAQGTLILRQNVAFIANGPEEY